jgi:exopolysaccharide biosynthesis polyprenyl glycosylphosphotransferase
MALTDRGVEAPPVTSTVPEVAPSAGVDRSIDAPRRLSPKTWLLLADTAAIVAAMGIAYAVRASVGGPRSLSGAQDAHLLVAGASLPLWLWLFARKRLYQARFLTRRLDEIRKVGSGAAYAIAAMTVAAYAFQLPVSRAWLAITYVVAIALLGLEREVVRRVFTAMRRRGRMLRRVIVVGGNDEAHDVAAMLDKDPTYGYELVGTVSDVTPGGAWALGPVAKTLALVRATEATSVILATSAMPVELSNRLVRELLRAGVHVELSSTLRDIAAHRLTVRPLGRFPIVYVEPCESTGWRAFAKRAFDLATAGVLLATMAPVAAVIALGIKLDSRGPVVYKQKRVGRNGEIFEFRKFRSMVPNAHDMWIDLREQTGASGPIFKLKDDPRVTRVGKILRKTSLDELPQLWNVLKGEMSLVGPRPALPEEMSMWDEHLHDRLRVRPGITGMWQVSGRSDAEMDEYTRLDLYYVDNWSLLTDLVVMMKTVPVVLFGRGAY